MSDPKIPVRTQEQESEKDFLGINDPVKTPTEDVINDSAFALKEKTPDWTQKYWD